MDTSCLGRLTHLRVTTVKVKNRNGEEDSLITLETNIITCPFTHLSVKLKNVEDSNLLTLESEVVWFLKRWS